MNLRTSALAITLSIVAGCASVGGDVPSFALPKPKDAPASANEITEARGAFLPRCWQGVSPRGLCIDGTGAVVELGLATMITILPPEEGER